MKIEGWDFFGGWSTELTGAPVWTSVTMTTPIGQTPHKCPVCGGNGLVSAGFYTSTTGVAATTGANPETCRSCEGEGMIWR